MPPPLSSPRGRRSAFRRRADGNVAAVSHGQHVLTPPLQPPDAPTRRWVKQPGDHDGQDLLILNVVSESHVTWATCVPILIFLGLSVLDLGPMYMRQTDRQTDRQKDRRQRDVRQTDVKQTDRRQTKASLNTPRLLGTGA